MSAEDDGRDGLLFAAVGEPTGDLGLTVLDDGRLRVDEPGFYRVSVGAFVFTGGAVNTYRLNFQPEFEGFGTVRPLFSELSVVSVDALSATTISGDTVVYAPSAMLFTVSVRIEGGTPTIPSDAALVIERVG